MDNSLNMKQELNRFEAAVLGTCQENGQLGQLRDTWDERSNSGGSVPVDRST